MTLQEAFDTAYRGLAAQGFRRSVAGRDYMCSYRGDKGRRCAVGHIIPDSLYRESIEGFTASGLPDDIIEFLGLPVRTLEYLQACHDNGDEPNAMKRLLSEFATDHDLTIPGAAS